MKNLFYLFILFLGLHLSACQQDSSNSDSTTSTTESGNAVIYKRVSNNEFKNLMATRTNAQLIDVRTPEEYSGGHIGQAQNINFHDDSFEAQMGQLDKAKPVLVYCQAGGRSQKACNKLKLMGFTEIYELTNGYGGWGE